MSLHVRLSAICSAFPLRGSPVPRTAQLRADRGGFTSHHLRQLLRGDALRKIGKGDALPVGEGYMNQVVWDALLSLVRRLVSAYRIPISRVVGHRERPSGREQGKTCPGFEVGVLCNLLQQQG